jgi:hypothetical protein
MQSATQVLRIQPDGLPHSPATTLSLLILFFSIQRFSLIQRTSKAFARRYGCVNRTKALQRRPTKARCSLHFLVASVCGCNTDSEDCLIPKDSQRIALENHTYGPTATL